MTGTQFDSNDVQIIDGIDGFHTRELQIWLRMMVPLRSTVTGTQFALGN